MNGRLPRVRAIVVSGSPPEVLGTCLNSLITQAGQRTLYNLEVYIIYNCVDLPEDKQSLPTDVKLICITNKTQFGFAANHNVASRDDGYDYVLWLNNDVVLSPAALTDLLEALASHPTAAAAAPSLYNPNGSPQRCGFSFPTWRSAFLAAFWPLSGRRMEGREVVAGNGCDVVDWVPATCLLVRRAALAHIGLLDEGFDPGYAEDLDWCYRAAQRGWVVLLCGNVKVIHYGGMTFGRISPRRYRLAVSHLLRYHRKHNSATLAWLIGIIWGLGFLGRWLIARLAGRLDQAQAYLSASLAAVKSLHLLTNLSSED